MEANYWQRLQRRRLSRRGLIAGAAVTAAGVVAGCGGGAKQPASQATSAAGTTQSSQTPQPGGTLFVSQKNNPGTLDPHRTTSDDTEVIAGATMSRLLRFQSGPTISVSEGHQTSLTWH